MFRELRQTKYKIVKTELSIIDGAKHEGRVRKRKCFMPKADIYSVGNCSQNQMVLLVLLLLKGEEDMPHFTLFIEPPFDHRRPMMFFVFAKTFINDQNLRYKK